MDSCFCFHPLAYELMKAGFYAGVGILLFLLFALARNKGKEKGSNGRGPR